MPKYNVYVTYTEQRVISEIIAHSREEALQIAKENVDSAEPIGDDDFEYELEEV